MPKTVYTEAQVVLVHHVIELRKSVGVTQVELARRLAKTQQFVSLIENGDRRIDVLEFCAILQVLGVDPVAAFAQLFERLPGRIDI